MPFEARIFRRWREANLPFEQNKNDGLALAGPTILLRSTSPICIVSVHGVNHYDRDGKLKQADLYTGGLAISLAEEFDTNLIYNLYRDFAISPRHGITAADRYIEELTAANSKLLVLDIHGAKDNLDFDIAVGTSVQPPNFYQIKLIKLFSAIAKKHKLKIAVNPRGYCGDGSHTITTRSIGKTPQCLQIEFSRSCRRADGSTVQSRRMLRTMFSFLSHLSAGARGSIDQM